MSDAIEPFVCEVPDAVLADLRRRLSFARFPDQLDGAGWDYGTERDFLRSLCTYWSETFDWRAAEVRFNAFPQFLTEIGGERVHFYHVRSPEPTARPLIITHGYPGSVAEFLDILGPLSDPAAHGGDPRDAFHVVAPSIPGYGFSGPTRNRGFDRGKAADVNLELMDRLGYDRYFAQGGDWGAGISSSMAEKRPDRLIGLHLNLIIGFPPNPDDPLAGLNETERAAMTWKREYDAHESAYQTIQATKPQSLAYGMADSPIGLAAWIVEKFRTWSDCGGDVERAFSKDQLLENIMLYWVTGTINSAMRLYYESIGPGRGQPLGRIKVPTGYAHFPREIRPTPRLWAEQVYTNIVSWTEMRRGGHFAAFEQPEDFVEEIRRFARMLR